jgi:hypothetical protein
LLVKRLSHLLFALCAALAVVASPVAAMAQQLRPVAVVSIASLDENLADIGYITRAAGNGRHGPDGAIAGCWADGGVDRTRPVGLYVVPQAGDFHAVAFLPVSDLRLLLQVHSRPDRRAEGRGGRHP